MSRNFYSVAFAVCFFAMGSVYPIRASAHPHLIVNAVDEYVHLFGGSNEHMLRATGGRRSDFSD